MIVVRFIFAIVVILKSHYGICNTDIPLTTDSRIKNYIYSPNEVYLLTLKTGFQSTVEFDKNESIETIMLGDPYAWQITPLNHRLFIKPTEANIHTNMTMITNRRIYHFDIVSIETLDKKNEHSVSSEMNTSTNISEENDPVYVVRFQYPKKPR